MNCIRAAAATSCLAGLLLAPTVASLQADEPAKVAQVVKPLWQRYLQGDDARKASELEGITEKLQETGRFEEALKTAEQLAQLRSTKQGADHWQTMDARGTVAVIRLVLRLGAENRDQYTRSFATQREAESLVNKGRYREAQPRLEKVLVDVRKVLGEEHPNTVLSYNNLAENLKAQAKYTEAAKGFGKALAICQKVLGEEHPHTALSYTNLASNLSAQGKYAKAEEGYRKALTICRKVFGEEHPETATSYNNLAFNLNLQSKYAQAELGLRKALAIRQKLLGENHADTASSYNNVAANLFYQGKYAEAEEGLRRAVAIRRKLLGEEHPETATSYQNLAASLKAQAKYAEATENNDRALTIRRKVFGEEHPTTARSYASVAANLNAQAKYSAAEEGYRKALTICRKVFGEEHPETATNYNNVAFNLEEQGKYAEAAEGYRKALTIRRKVFGEEHPATASSYNNAAINLDDQGKYAEAAEGFRKALAIRRKFLGEEHPDTVTSYNNLALNLNVQSRFAEAEQDLRKALAIRRKVFGENHPATATSYNNLARCLHDQSKYTEAEQGFRKALEIFRKVLGEDHLRTAHSYKNVAFNLNAQGKYAEAEALWLVAADRFGNARLHIAATGLDRAAISGEDSPLPNLAAVLARNDKPEPAWRWLEESLGRGTWDDMSARLRRPQADQAKQIQLVGKLDQLNKLIEGTLSAKQTSQELNKQRAELLTEQRKVQDELTAFARHLELTYGPVASQVFDRQQIQASLPADAALVGWLDIAGTRKSADPSGEHWAFLLRSKGDPIVVRVRGCGPNDSWTDSDTRLPADLRVALKSPRGDWRPLVELLRQQRLAPLEKHLAAGNGLPAVRRLIVLPSTALAGVPVEVFANDYAVVNALKPEPQVKEAEPTGATAKTATDGYVVSYATSGTLYAHQRKQPSPKTKGLFALADPIFDQPKSDAPPAPLPKSGVMLTAVAPGGNAAQAQLKPGDVLLRYADAKLTGTADLDEQIAAHEKDQRVTVRVWREGQEFDRALRPGKLGVVLATDPAPKAVAERRKTDLWLASRGGDDEKWEQLPGTRIEVQALLRLFTDSAANDAPNTKHETPDTSVSSVLADSDASEQQLYDLTKSGELGKYRYLHLATHGVVDDRFPLRSAVILSRDKLPDPGKQLDAGLPIFDGKLTAEEVLRNWNLNAELVTLSACQTGLGKYERGEGFVGFAQALLLAGSRSVCLSMWKVDDAATALLMARFYENLLGKRAGLKVSMKKAEALAEAKAWLRGLSRDQALQRAAELTSGVARGKGRPALPVLPALPKPASAAKDEQDRPYAHPYYWAAFVLIGDGE